MLASKRLELYNQFHQWQATADRTNTDEVLDELRHFIDGDEGPFPALIAVGLLEQQGVARRLSRNACRVLGVLQQYEAAGHEEFWDGLIHRSISITSDDLFDAIAELSRKGVVEMVSTDLIPTGFSVLEALDNPQKYALVAQYQLDTYEEALDSHMESKDATDKEPDKA